MRMAASSAASAGTVGPACPLVSFGQPVPGRVAHHAPEEPLGDVAGVLVDPGGETVRPAAPLAGVAHAPSHGIGGS